MRYSYATVSLPTLRPAEAVVALREAGFQGIEWKVGNAPHAAGSNAESFLASNLCTIEPTVAAAGEAARVAASAGLETVGLSPYVRVGDLDAMRLVLEMAEAAGAPQIRLQAQRFHGDERYLGMRDDLVRFLEASVPEARRRRVRILIEIHHKTIVPSVGLALPVLDRLDADAVGVIYDVGNMVWEGYEDYRIGIELLGKRLRHVHLKNVSAERGADGAWQYRWAALDDGLVDAAHVLDLLDRIGYRGWVSMEDLTFPDDSAAGIRHNAAVLTRMGAPGWTGSERADAPETHLTRG